MNANSVRSHDKRLSKHQAADTCFRRVAPFRMKAELRTKRPLREGLAKGQ